MSCRHVKRRAMFHRVFNLEHSSFCINHFWKDCEFTEVYRRPILPPGRIGGGMVGVLTSRLLARAASAPAGVRRPMRRPVRRSNFRAIALVRADGPTLRKSRAR